MDWNTKVGKAFEKEGVIYILVSHSSQPTLTFKPAADGGRMISGEVGSLNCQGFKELAPLADADSRILELGNPNPCGVCHKTPAIEAEKPDIFKVSCAGAHHGIEVRNTRLFAAVTEWNEKNPVPF